MQNAKSLRLSRFFFPETETGLIVPIDHGLTMGPLPGLSTISEIAAWISHPAISGVIAHKGTAERLIETGALNRKGLMIHLNGMSTLSEKPDNKIPLTSIETALRLGADGVSFQVNFDGTNDAQNLETMGKTVDAAQAWGIPVLAMVYDKVKADLKTETSRIQHLIRISLELGCDAVKIGAPRALEEVIGNAAKDIKIFVAGGNVSDTESIAELGRRVVNAGGAGLCVGRNVFQRPGIFETLETLKASLHKSITPNAEPSLERMVYGIH